MSRQDRNSEIEGANEEFSSDSFEQKGESLVIPPRGKGNGRKPIVIHNMFLTAEVETKSFRRDQEELLAKQILFFGTKQG